MSRRTTVALFLTLSVLCGLSFPAISVGLGHLPLLLFAAFRYDVAAALLLVYAITRIDRCRPRGRNDYTAVAGGGLFLVAGNGLLFVGQQAMPSSVAAILQALVPIATALWALLLLGERLSAVGAAGIALGFLGVGFVVQLALTPPVRRPSRAASRCSRPRRAPGTRRARSPAPR